MPNSPVACLLHPIQVVPQKVVVRRPRHQVPVGCHGAVVQHGVPRHGPFLQALLQVRHEELVELAVLVEEGQGELAGEPAREDAARVRQVLERGGGRRERERGDRVPVVGLSGVLRAEKDG